MLDYEAKVKAAKKAGEQPPPLKSLFNPDAQLPTKVVVGTQEVEVPGGEPVPEGFEFSKSALKLTPHERELELRLANREAEEAVGIFEELQPWVKEREEAKLRRKEKLSKFLPTGIVNWVSP